MKLKNKKTGEIGYLTVSKGSDHYVVCDDEWHICGKYNSLAELNAEWEDVPEEPKTKYYYFVSPIDEGITQAEEMEGDEVDEFNKQIGNYFNTREEAEKAVEKLRAYKRLKDKGFKVDLWDYDGGNYQERISTGRILFRVKDYEENDKDLDLLFGGEE